MKALIQRVHHASVAVNQHIIGEIDAGVLAYIGIGKTDDIHTAKKLIDKILTYRIFENTTDADKLGKLDKSVLDVQGGLLLVSQFTLMANTDKGRRADFAPAMPPAQAQALFAELVAYARTQHHKIATGEFGANMTVMAANDGPINFLLEV
ncbi:MAG: D-aminoacyl-tRNA deacylase [Moraxella sp.]|nr:D-aminoacyl-tRNA deacylase [Moraxella sp.]